MLIDDLGLRLPESDEVNEIGKYFDQSIMSRFGQISESEVVDTTLLNDKKNKLVFLSLRPYTRIRHTSIISLRRLMKKPMRLRVSNGTMSG